MSKVYLMIGIQGSGKTTFAKKFADENGLEYVASDEIRFDRYSEFDPEDEAEVWREVRLRIEKSLKAGKDFVLDSTMASKLSRKSNINFIRSIDTQADISGIYVTTDKETAEAINAKREKPVPAEAIENFYKRLSENPPSNEDGFDHIIYLDSEFNPISETDRELLNEVHNAPKEFKPKMI